MAKTERTLPEVLELDFIICDNSVNRYGWRLLVAGIDLTGFLKNPVCCVQHATYMIPVGRWKNLRVEGEELKGTVDFDRNDEDAVKLYWKYKDGYMNAVSLHVLPVEESEDAALLLPGQKSATLTKSEMLEISLVTIPGQKNAVKLSTTEMTEYKPNLLTTNKMDKKEEKTVEQLQQELKAQRQLNAENLVLRHQARGVVQDGEIDSLKTLAFENYETVSKMLDGRTKPEPAKQEGDTAEAKADALVALHFDRGAISAGEKPIYKAYALTNYDSAQKELSAKPGKEGLQTFMQGMGNGTAQPVNNERAGWGYYEYFKKDPAALALMKKNEPEKYKKLVADFEAESKSLGIGVQPEE
jgi:phage head maturation protease